MFSAFYADKEPAILKLVVTRVHRGCDVVPQVVELLEDHGEADIPDRRDGMIAIARLGQIANETQRRITFAHSADRVLGFGSVPIISVPLHRVIYGRQKTCCKTKARINGEPRRPGGASKRESWGRGA